MSLVLLTLFAIALTITVAGWLLSSHSPLRLRLKRPTPTTTRYSNHTYRYQQHTAQIRAQRRSLPKIQYAQQQVELRPSLFDTLNVKQFFTNTPIHQIPWLGTVLVLIALFSFGMLTVNSALASNGVVILNTWPNLPSLDGAKPATQQKTTPQLNLQGASKAMIRLGQMDHSQYASLDEFDTWAASACSAASMTVVINSYGHSYRITDILRAERAQKQITPELGLLYPTGIDRTVEQFGFQATHLNRPSYEEAIKIASNGQPIIISFPPGTWSGGGHILVLRGGTDKEVYLTDSSTANMTTLSREKFLSYWRGFAVVVTPK